MQTHDYTRRYWGHDYVFMPSQDDGPDHMMGWGRGIDKDDFLILGHDNSNETTRYQVVEIEYSSDPPDMWSADVEFSPRP